MPKFAKKWKKQLRRILYSKIFSCFWSKEIQDQSDPPLNPSNTVVSQKLEILLLKTLKNQLEEREYHNQLKNAVFQITQILEQIGKNHDLREKLSQCFPNDGFSKFCITLSKDCLIHCQTDARKKSLVLMNERNDVVPSGSAVVLHKCQNDIFHLPEGIIPRGKFSSLLWRLSDEKGVQYDPQFSQSMLKTNSKLIQTQFLNFSNFQIDSFKINLVKHIRNLKQDVVSLRQLLHSLESHPVGCRLNAKDVSVYAPDTWNEEFGHKFFEAKLRASNFVKFYKLRIQGDRKKLKGRGKGKNK